MDPLLALIVGAFAVAFAVAIVLFFFLMRSRREVKELISKNDEFRRMEIEKARFEQDLKNISEQHEKTEKRAIEAEAELAEKTTELAGVKADQQARQQELEKARQQLDLQFKGIAAQVVESTSDELRKRADRELEARQKAVEASVKPVGESLKEFQARVQEIENAREGAYAELLTAVKNSGEVISQLRTETGHLHRALRSARVRGNWGEQQLRNVVEAAGMLEHVEFTEQETMAGQESTLRPDMIVRIPGEKRIVLDSKMPMDAYLDAYETEDSSRQKKLFEQHANTLLGHAHRLASKEYTYGVEGSFEFVVMFLGHDNILDAAERTKSGIWDQVWRNHHVLIATPGLLIALLNTIAVGWKQAKVEKNAQAIVKEASEFYDRLRVYMVHVNDVSVALNKAVDAQTKSVGSLRTRLLITARKIEKMGGADKKAIPELVELEEKAELLSAPELQAPLPSEQEAIHTDSDQTWVKAGQD